MESEGPYTLRSNDKPDGEWLVFGPSLNPSGSFEFCGEDLASALNSAHAEGRRSMEKEFKELLKFASGMRLQGMAKGGLKMTDDKGAGEEEYTHKCSAVVCEICGFNRGYAEGRKAMEKEFNELLELANEAGQFNKDMMEWKIKFDSWKKARGIE